RSAVQHHGCRTRNRPTERQQSGREVTHGTNETILKDEKTFFSLTSSESGHIVQTQSPQAPILQESFAPRKGCPSDRGSTFVVPLLVDDVLSLPFIAAGWARSRVPIRPLVFSLLHLDP